MLYSSFSTGVAMNKSGAKEVSWMPNKILHLYYQTSNDDKYVHVYVYVWAIRQFL